MSHKPCKWFALGECWRGNKCWYSHTGYDYYKSPECEYCKQGKCKYGYFCKFKPKPAIKSKNECSYYYNGKCKYLNKYCKKLHFRDDDFNQLILCAKIYKERMTRIDICELLYSYDGIAFYSVSAFHEMPISFYMTIPRYTYPTILSEKSSVRREAIQSGHQLINKYKQLYKLYKYMKLIGVQIPMPSELIKYMGKILVNMGPEPEILIDPWNLLSR